MRNEFERTIGFAEGSVHHIRENQVPAYPKTYEVWFTHLSGANRKLSIAIEEMIAKFGRVSAGQILHLHETFISNDGYDDKVDRISNRINGEAENLQKIIQKSYNLAQEFGISLNQASDDLKIELDQESLHKLIQRLALETAAVEGENRKLVEELKTAHIGIQQLHENLKEVRQETLMDDLTAIGNRRHFDRSLAKILTGFQTSREPTCLIMADIDHFKKFNDKWGHQTGDQVLRLVALAIRNNIKMQDIACRYGGEEFAIILPGVTLDQAKLVAERIRLAVAKRDVVKRSTGENLGKITISGGIAFFNREDTAESIIRRADSCLYLAKKSGRNLVITEREKAARKVA